MREALEGFKATVIALCSGPFTSEELGALLDEMIEEATRQGQYMADNAVQVIEATPVPEVPGLVEANTDAMRAIANVALQVNNLALFVQDLYASITRVEAVVDHVDPRHATRKSARKATPKKLTRRKASKKR